jgi:hypothetical protein
MLTREYAQMFSRPPVYLRSPYDPSEADGILLSIWCTPAYFPEKQSQVQPLHMTARLQMGNVNTLNMALYGTGQVGNCFHAWPSNSNLVGTSCWNENSLTEVLFKCARLNSCICSELKPVNTLTRGQSRSKIHQHSSLTIFLLELSLMLIC